MSPRVFGAFAAGVLVAFAFPFLELRLLTATGTTTALAGVSGYGILAGSAPYRLTLVITGLIRAAAFVCVAATVAGAVTPVLKTRSAVPRTAAWLVATASLIGLAAAARVSARDVGLGRSRVFGGGHQIMTLGPGLWVTLGLSLVATVWSLVAATIRPRRPVRG